MSRGTFKVIVKSANLTKVKNAPSKLELFAQIIFGEQVKKTKVAESSGLNPVWNEAFTFKKQDEYRLGIQVFNVDSDSKDELVGMQEVGINSFIKKKNVFDHPVELMNEGAIIGEVLLSIEYVPEPKPTQSWQNTNLKQKQVGVHKILITKIKANLDFENVNLPQPPVIANLSPILKITMGKKIWRTSTSSSPGKNLKWQESFNLVIESEKELSLEIIEGEQVMEERLGSAVLKLKAIPQGTSPNKVPLILDGQQVGFLYFQTEYQVPQVPTSQNLEESYISNVGRLASPLLKRNGKLVVSTIRVYLEKNLQVTDPYVLILWGSEIEKSSVLTGQTTSKPEWKQLIFFNNTQFEGRIEVKLLDKSSQSDDDIIGYGYLILDQYAQEGGKFRSQKIELFNEESLQGQMYIDFEFKFDYQGQKDLKNDPLDMKKKTKPSEEELKKREMLQKRKELMKQSVMSTERNKSFLPQLDENSNIFRLKTPVVRYSPQPKSAVKSVHSISLPKINYDIKVREYNQIYKDSVFGLGMSNVHSAQSLRHSIQSFSMSKAERFQQKKYDGFDSFNYNAPSYFNNRLSDNSKYLKNKVFTPDQRYEIFHKSPTQKPGVSFGVGRRFEIKVDSSPGYYQGPRLLNYNE